MSLPRFRAFCFTWNNYTEDDVDFLRGLTTRLTYIIFGREIAPTTGTPHLQGYLRFINARTKSGVIKLFKKKAHVEVAAGTEYQNYNYCNKDKDSFVWGEIGEQGKRNDIDEIKKMVREGATKSEIWDVASNWQSYRMGEKGIELQEEKRKQEPRTWKPTVLWYYGSTGKGKSEKAFGDYPKAWCTGNIVNNFIFDGYAGEDVCILDDLRPNQIKFQELLRVFDKYPYRVRTLGGSRQFVARTIVVTTTKHPIQFYEGRTDEDIEQLLRRITEIVNFDTQVGGNTSGPSLC